MNKSAILIGVLSGSLAWGQAASASSAQYGDIYGIIGMNNGVVLFSTTGTRTGDHPSCQGSGLEGRYAIDGSTTMGQSQISVLLTAYAQGKRIFVAGANSCEVWSNTETVVYIKIE